MFWIVSVGEAQKIERLVDAFADRYKECNPSDVLSRDSVFILAFAIIMLNTDLHKPTNSRNRMTPEQWLTNLKGVFMEGDLQPKFLTDIYKRIKKQELVTGTDHVTQVIKVQSSKLLFFFLYFRNLFIIIFLLFFSNHRP